MTKAIMNALDLPELSSLLGPCKDTLDNPDVTAHELDASDLNLQLISDSLNLGATTQEVVESQNQRDHETGTETIYRETLQHAKDLMDLGYNVDTRSAKGIFESAASMFRIALDAKNTKRDGQFKQMKIKMDNRKVDLMERQITGAKDSDVLGESVIIEDRNDLIRRMREQAGKDVK